MMNQSTMIKTADSAKELFEMIMGMYSTYLKELEKIANAIPASETNTLIELNQHVAEVHSAIEHDMGIFEEAINYDKENLHKLKDKLKIDSIYKTLGNK